MPGSVIFVPGTGVRQSVYDVAFETVAQKVQKWIPGFIAVKCNWGEMVGARLNHGGKSIPEYNSATGAAATDAANVMAARWRLLYDDPLFELRLLEARAGSGERGFNPAAPSPIQEIDAALGKIVGPDLDNKLAEAELRPFWTDAVNDVRSAPALLAGMAQINELTTFERAIVARSLVAQCIRLYRASRQMADPDATVPIPFDGAFRDELVDLVRRHLGPTDLAFGIDWLSRQCVGVGKSLGTSYLTRRRNALSDAGYPIAGDILLYQAHGHRIRNYIRAIIGNARKPCIVLAHSLGGVACVELLIDDEVIAIEALVTIGSQAPFFYEIDALHTLPHSKQLPPWFPHHWLNFYDLRDCLSYIGKGVFPDRVEDFEVDNLHPFPDAHTTYWENKEFWKKLNSELAGRMQIKLVESESDSV